MAGANSLKTIFYALGANSAIAVAKLVAATITGSGAMLAEGIHSVADAGNQLLLLLGLKESKKTPTDSHPLGHGKNIYFWSFVVAIILFSLGGMFSIYEGLHKLHSHEPLSQPWIAIAVLIFAILAEGVSLRACIIEVNKVRAGRSYWRWFRDSRQSELIVIFGEDIAALLGLMLALAAVALTLITGNPLYDALGTLAIGGFLILIAILIGIEVKALLVGQSADPEVVKRMRAFLAEQDDIDTVFNLITLQLGSEVMVALKAKMHEAGGQKALIHNINAIEKRFKAAFPDVTWLFFEPDTED